MEYCLSTEDINSYGTRIITDGIDMSAFKSNPVLFYNHDRSNFPLGTWQNVKKLNGRLYGTPVIDEGSEKGRELKRLMENGTIKATSVGLQVLETSNDPRLMLPGQKLPTVTKSKLMEVSMVDIPSNQNALRLYSKKKIGNFIFLNMDNLQELQDAFHAVENKDEEILAQLKLVASQTQELKSIMEALKISSEEILSLKAEIAELKAKPTLTAKDIVEYAKNSAINAEPFGSTKQEGIEKELDVKLMAAMSEKRPQHVSAYLHLYRNHNDLFETLQRSFPEKLAALKTIK